VNIGKLFVCVLAALVLTACAGSPEVKEEKKNADVAAKANTELGVEYLREGNYELSKKKLEKALELEPNYAPAHDAIAVLYARVGEPRLAEKHYKKSLKLSPDSARGHNNYGQFLCFQDRHKEATAQFMKAAENSFYPTPELPLTNAGMCLAQEPDLEEAEKFYRKALEVRPTYGEALLQLCLLKYQELDFLSARAFLQRYMAVSTVTAGVLYLAAEIEGKLGNDRGRAEFVDQLLREFPDSPEADKASGSS